MDSQDQVQYNNPISADRMPRVPMRKQAGTVRADTRAPQEDMFVFQVEHGAREQQIPPRMESNAETVDSPESSTPRRRRGFQQEVPEETVGRQEPPQPEANIGFVNHAFEPVQPAQVNAYPPPAHPAAMPGWQPEVSVPGTMPFQSMPSGQIPPVPVQPAPMHSGQIPPVPVQPAPMPSGQIPPVPVQPAPIPAYGSPAWEQSAPAAIPGMNVPNKQPVQPVSQGFPPVQMQGYQPAGFGSVPYVPQQDFMQEGMPAQPLNTAYPPQPVPAGSPAYPGDRPSQPEIPAAPRVQPQTEKPKDLPDSGSSNESSDEAQDPDQDRVPFYESRRGNRNRPSFSEGLFELPRDFARYFTQPQDVLRYGMESENRATPLITGALVLVLSFLCGMLLSRGVVRIYLRLLREINQVDSITPLVNVLSGKSMVTMGLTACGSALVSMCVNALSFVCFVCVIRRYTFSADLLLGGILMSALPALGGCVLALLLSLVSPFAVLLAWIMTHLVTMVLYVVLLLRRLDPRDRSVLPQVLVLCAIMTVCWFVIWYLPGNAVLAGARAGMIRYLGIAHP